MSETCELCGATAEMDFNAVVPVSKEEALTIKADICLGCWGSYPDDMAIVMAVLEKRVGTELSHDQQKPSLTNQPTVQTA